MVILNYQHIIILYKTKEPRQRNVRNIRFKTLLLQLCVFLGIAWGISSLAVCICCFNTFRIYQQKKI